MAALAEISWDARQLEAFQDRPLSTSQVKQRATDLIPRVLSVVTILNDFPAQSDDIWARPNAFIEFDRNDGNFQITHRSDAERRSLTFFKGNGNVSKEATIDAINGTIRYSEISLDCQNRSKCVVFENTPRAINKVETLFEGLVVSTNGK